jgi:hypothetical protein
MAMYFASLRMPFVNNFLIGKRRFDIGQNLSAEFSGVGTPNFTTNKGIRMWEERSKHSSIATPTLEKVLPILKYSSFVHVQ